MKKYIDRYYIIDILKLISTIIIVFHHYQQVTGLRFNRLINFYGGRFYFGYLTELFFMISGVLTYKYISIVLQNNITFTEFIYKKIFRIYIHIPFTIVCMLIIQYLKSMFINQTFGITVYDIVGSLFLFHSFGIVKNTSLNYPIWYISVLFLCFVIFYSLCKLSSCSKINITILFAIMIIIGVIIFVANYCFLIINSSTARGILSYFLGLCIVQIKTKADNQPTKQTIIQLFLFITYILCVAILLLTHKSTYLILVFIVYPVLMFISLNYNYIIRDYLYWTKLFGNKLLYVYLWHSIFIELFVLFNVNISCFSMILCLIIVFVFSFLYDYVLNNLIFKF